MYGTVETRWFGRGEPSPEIMIWFNACRGAAERQPLRRDHYLYPIEGDGLSLKVRDGGLEIKQRLRRYGIFRWQRSVVGLVEGWQKRRFALEDPGSHIASGDHDPSEWLAVSKERQLRRYQADAGGGVWPASPESTVLSGCEVELTRLRAGGNDWWTVAFEAFGEEAGNYQRLLTVADFVLEEGAPQTLTAANSFAYPHWLALIIDNDK